MKIGKLHIGWRPMDDDEALAFNLPLRPRLLGFFIEWGDDQNGFGVCVLTKPRP